MESEHDSTTGDESELRRQFRQAMKVAARSAASLSTCPDSDVMAAYITGMAPEATRRELNAHIAACDECWDDYVALAGAEKIAELVRTAAADHALSMPIAIGEAREKWARLVARAKDFIIDLGRTYAPGTVIGLIKIHPETPLIARGAVKFQSAKLLEVMVADNVYGIEIRAGQQGLLFEIAGYKVSSSVPIAVAVHSEAGESLGETRTNKLGNAQLSIPAEKLSSREVLLAIGHADQLDEVVLLRLPAVPEQTLAQIV